MLFTELGLSQPILEAIAEEGYTEPSPIQAKAIPEVLQGRDVMAAAQTGTGKTAGFTLPILHYLSTHDKPAHKGNQARVLVLTPTRELAAQVAESVKTYSRFLKIKTAVVFGGVGINPQMQQLRGGVDVLVATPGRLLDLHSQNAVQFDKLEMLVLDEADRMLDMGFIHDIRRIIKLLPKKRQTLMFSATFSNDIRQLAKTIVYQPVEVSVSPPNSTVDAVAQKLIVVEKTAKSQVLTHLIQSNDWFQVLVFSRTKHGANRLAKQLTARGVEAAAIHGNKSQGARTRALADFKQNKLRVLVATDIAARGIDIDLLPHVVNFDLPQVAEDYVHRIGRTGRAGASGEAISLVSHDEFKLLTDIERLIKKQIPREELEGFEPINNLPASQTEFKAQKPNKPKRNRNRNASGKPGSRPGGKSEGRGSSDSAGRNESTQKPGRRSKKSTSRKRKPGGGRNSSQPGSAGSAAGRRRSGPPRAREG
ncbi:MAG: DEAD/DEAH box helicase [Gammaproteobacteria bacterium]|nr:DEAD/DEAH box helicase [Gammaproteobacteria bacterium]